MQKKKLLVFLLTVATLFCLDACGGEQTINSNTPQSVGTGETSVVNSTEITSSNTEVPAPETKDTTVENAVPGLSLSDAAKTLGSVTIREDKLDLSCYKNRNYNNPISSEFFCADPTAIEYNGRLYLFGTNDHQQYEVAGPQKDNTYEHIKSLVILSTEDMVNWTYHGEINTAEVAPWITNSWAPSIASRVEDDGLTHFYLYFSNNGLGVGVITATDPLGPWEDPLGEPFISTKTPGLKNCPNPFDPGVVIDDNGDAYLAFGGGKSPQFSNYMPGSSKIVKLGDDMLSFASDFVDIPAPYFFEASELNYINGTYVYTYNTDWSDHTLQWDYDCEAPSMCSMVYMTTKTPLDSNSWEMQGEYFKNPGLSGFDYCNNHTHLHKYNGQYYIFYQNMLLKTGMAIPGAYRNLGVDTISVNEETVTIEAIGGTKSGVAYISSVNPFEKNQAVNLNNTSGIVYNTADMKNPIISSTREGSWISVKNVEFTTPTTDPTETSAYREELTNVTTIQYNINVKSVDKETVVSMYPSAKGGADCIGSVTVSEPGAYTITCELGDVSQIQNMGYFAVDNDAQITMMVDSLLVNRKYEFMISSELTNTRDWANGLKNIWSGVADGETVYDSETASFKYNGSTEAIEFFVLHEEESASSAPFVSFPMAFIGEVKGSGQIEIRTDNPHGETLTFISFDTTGEVKTIYNDIVAEIGGIQDLYFIFSDENIELISWQFVEQ